MKNNSFEMAMNKIVGQAEAERQQEITTQKRRETFGRIRQAAVGLFFVAALAVAFCCRAELQATFTAFITPKPAAPPAGQASAALSGAQQNAATRDSVIAEISK